MKDRETFKYVADEIPHLFGKNLGWRTIMAILLGLLSAALEHWTNFWPHFFISSIVYLTTFTLLEYFTYQSRKRSRIEMEGGRFRFYNGGKKPHVDISVTQIRRLGYDQANGNRCLFLSDYDIFRIPQVVENIEGLDKRLQLETGLEFVSLTDLQPVVLKYSTSIPS